LLLYEVTSIENKELIMNGYKARFDEIFMSYVNGQTSQWKRQLKRLRMGERAECIDYIRQERDEDAIAHRMSLIVIAGEL